VIGPVGRVVVGPGLLVVRVLWGVVLLVEVENDVVVVPVAAGVVVAGVVAAVVVAAVVVAAVVVAVEVPVIVVSFAAVVVAVALVVSVLAVVFGVVEDGAFVPEEGGAEVIAPPEISVMIFMISRSIISHILIRYNIKLTFDLIV